jgi:hypothetical protein
MAYKRPNIAKPLKPHPIEETWGHLKQFDHLKTMPGWIYEKVLPLLSEWNFALGQLASTVDGAVKADYSELKDHIAKEKRAKAILKARQAQMTFFRKAIEAADSEVKKSQNAILRVTEPDAPSDPVKAMLQQMKYAEIRANLKAIEPKHRSDSIRGNLERIKALVANPDSADIIVSQETLAGIRRQYAFDLDSSLQDEERDTTDIYQAVRKTAGAANATGAAYLVSMKQEDPLPLAEHYQVFTPENEYNKYLADKRVHEWEKAKAAAEKTKEFNENHAELNLQAGERTERTTKGIQHKPTAAV